MLILTITKDDPITIGNTTIHQKDGGQVRLAIDAPREVLNCGEERRSG